MVITSGINDLPFEFIDGEKVFTLVAHPMEWEILDGIYVNGWGYNNSIPGPTIHVLPGDNVRIRVINKLPQKTSVHWHGLIVPNVMDGVPGVEPSPYIESGDSFDYRFKIINPPGTYMYHTHVNDVVQGNMGLCGGFIVDDLDLMFRKKYKDYFLFLQEWALDELPFRDLSSGTYNINYKNPDYNFFTINGKCFPNSMPLQVEYGDIVRVRFANLQMNHHPMHLHGHEFKVVATGGFPIRSEAQIYNNTILVASGQTWDIEFEANNPGVWPLHCHMPHHMSNNGSFNLGGMFTTVNYIK